MKEMTLPVTNFSDTPNLLKLCYSFKMVSSEVIFRPFTVGIYKHKK